MILKITVSKIENLAYKNYLFSYFNLKAKLLRVADVKEKPRNSCLLRMEAFNAIYLTLYNFHLILKMLLCDLSSPLFYEGPIDSISYLIPKFHRTISNSSLWGSFYLLCCCCSVPKSCSALCNPMNSSTPGFSVLHHLPEFAHIHIHWVSDANHLILCHPFLLLPSLFLSIRVLSNEPAFPIRWPKDWSFSISPSNEYSGLISFRIDWFDLAVHRTLKSLLQHHNSKASILWLTSIL